MKILVIGSGGREHAMVWKLAQSEKVKHIWVAPGNGGTADEEKTENLPLTADPSTEEGQQALLEFVQAEKIDLTVVGPEAPLAAGIVDKFREAKLAIIGPDKKAARLEASKVYSKSFMEKYGVRAAKSKSFTDPVKALAYAEDNFKKKPKLVIKADGLAAGKGVVIAENFAEAKDCLSSFMKSGSLGDAGKSVVLEEFLQGKEVSILAAVSVKPGKKGVIKPFISARDHKRRFEGAQGPNTGGMGAIAPVPDFSSACEKDFIDSILAPTLKGMEKEKMDYRGFIFFGLMVHEGKCSLLEYNVRLGDPETQAVLPLMDSDLVLLCRVILDNTLADFLLKWKKEFCCAPVLVAKGYPGAYPKGNPIAINPTGIGRSGARLFIAGAQRGQGGPLGSGLRTAGGRVLAISANGASADEAWEKAYEALRFVDFEGMAYRKDIGREDG
ncbi:phosphoribosylamine--glycine ligase [Leadbettera azotonutricia]|uniref:Phosphoribosylamine--glycine ligase n=1 Tax=Leadbettera azotonutricia (strain ATCC BAA-888 / DSM 13862 / ZAS-9) TaxID=545695 RepID=F5YF27_LEAAZ|nr:phosphoribosylamine--glycine ligase [Leadbettera azotonutricia]AEF82878.1 phosphoribosylamine--glycine ligase [Leadbettera azotonutricia ZAS-9]